MSVQTKVAKRMLWLAYQASRIVGMGFLQARNDVTEDTLWETHSRPRGDGVEVSADYAFGKMMKFFLKVEGGDIVLPGVTLNVEYQSWACRYDSYEALKTAAMKSLAQENTKETV